MSRMELGGTVSTAWTLRLSRLSGDANKRALDPENIMPR